MQFAGQRTTLSLDPIGEPDNILIKMVDDVLPEPEAILITGITPQQTQLDGISEREFCEYFIDNIATPNTTILGYNTIRFDNEFIRFILYRNFYDAYEWSYKNGISTWDMLDVVRMTRALRPNGIKWPFSSDGKPSNKLELLTSVNNINHINAHDALSDVIATIEIAKLIKSKQPKLFDYLYLNRTKQSVQSIVNSQNPFVYTSGRYSSEYEKTTVALKMCDDPIYGSSRALVYDLRIDPSEYIKLSIPDLASRLEYNRDNPEKMLPVKRLTYNKSPAIAPITVLDNETKDRLKINIEDIKKNILTLQNDPTFVNRISQVFEQKREVTEQQMIYDMSNVDEKLYDGFFNDADKRTMQKVRSTSDNEMVDYSPIFNDERLGPLFNLYKARQFPRSLNESERKAWDNYRYNKMLSGDESSLLAKYFSKIQILLNQEKDESRISLLQDLWLWGESIAPSAES
jgi:exodeoxyribonuclease-1